MIAQREVRRVLGLGASSGIGWKVSVSLGFLRSNAGQLPQGANAAHGSLPASVTYGHGSTRPEPSRVGLVTYAAKLKPFPA